MNKVVSYIAIGVIAIVFLGCTGASGPKLPANYYYEGSYIDIHSPNSEGWHEAKKSTSQIVFLKDGNVSGESYVARVIFFPLETTDNKEEFLNLIKNNETKNSNLERFIPIESSFKLSEQRSYSCVIAKQISKDKMAKTSLFSTEEQFMQVKSLYCKDPKSESRGFMVGYSFRGYKVNKNFDEEANSFIDGVQFPKIH